MTKVSEMVSWLDQIAPRSLAADWDNTGLLMGDFSSDVNKVLVCLTLTKEVADEARALHIQAIESLRWPAVVLFLLLLSISIYHYCTD